MTEDHSTPSQGEKRREGEMIEDADELRDPHEGELIDIGEGRKFRVGAFYWVMPTLDPDIPPGLGWMGEVQPARFAGANEAGEPLWQCLCLEGEERHNASNWAMCWTGEEIVPPNLRKAAD